MKRRKKPAILKNMNRRLFFKYIALCGASFLKWPLFGLGEKPVKVVYKNIPKKPIPPVSSAEEFFYKCYGKYSNYFITKHIKNGNILEVDAWLSSDKQTAVSKFVFKNSRALKECDSQWIAKYPEDLDPVHYAIVDIA